MSPLERLWRYWNTVIPEVKRNIDVLKKRVIVKSRLLILELWFLFHLLTIHFILQKQVTVFFAPWGLFQSSVMGNSSVGIVCVDDWRCGFSYGWGSGRTWKVLFWDLNAILVTLGESLHFSAVQFLHPFSGNRHEDNFRVAGSNLQGMIINYLAHMKGNLNTK